MKYFPKTLSKKESIDFIKRMQVHFTTFKYCYFAVDILETKEFIGFTGLLHQSFKSEFTPCIDIGWRLKKSTWGKGFATEGAKGCLNYASEHLNLKEIYSIAPISNLNSIEVMKKIGMSYHSKFQHPALLLNAFLKDCVVYHITL